MAPLRSSSESTATLTTAIGGEQCYVRARDWWHLLAVTLPLDAILVLYRLEIFPAPNPSTLVLLGALCAAAILVDRGRGLSLLTGMDRFRGWLVTGSRSRRAIIIGLGVALITGEMLMRIGSAGLAATLFIMLAVFIAYREVTKAMGSLSKKHAQLESDIQARISSLNERNLALFLTQLSAVRVYALMTAVAAAQTGSWSMYATGAAGALLSFAALQPERDEFFAPCSQCGQPVSRPKGAGSKFCPVCDARRSLKTGGRI